MRRRRTLAGPLDPHYYWPVVLLCIFVIHFGDVLGHDPATTTTTTTVRTRARSSPTCRTDAKSIISKTYVSPYVFEGSVLSVPDSDDHPGDRQRHHRVTFRVDRVHKGDPGRVISAQKQISLQFWSRRADNDDGAANRCVFRPDIFQSRRKFIVFAADARVNGDLADVRRPNVTRITMDDDDDDVEDDLWWGSQATEMPTFFVFCEPVALNKKSSRRIQKILRHAKPPTVSGLKNVTVRLHKRLKFVCRAKGRPAPTITWFKDGRPLVENSNVFIRFNRSVSQLRIRNAMEEDGGLYECRATIEATGLSSVVNATVTVKKRGRSVSSLSPNSTPSPKSDKKGFGDTFTGKECPVEHFCQNNSTCVFIENLGEAYCRCVDGFVGGRCEHKNVFFVLGEVKQMDWTYHKNILTVVVILGVLLCITILSNVTYFVFRAKRKIQKEKKEVPTDGGRGRLSVVDGDAVEMQHVISNRAELVRRQDDFYVSDDGRDTTRPRSTSLQPSDNRHHHRRASKWTMATGYLDPPHYSCCDQECHSRRPLDNCSFKQKCLSIRRLHRLDGVSGPMDTVTPRENQQEERSSSSRNRPVHIRDLPECSKNDDEIQFESENHRRFTIELAGNSCSEDERFLKTTAILN